MIRVIEINEIELLTHIRASWQTVWQQTPGAGFFQTLPWLESYWKHFSRGKQLRVLLIVEEDILAGVVPLVVVPERTRLGSLKVLTYPLADWGNHYGCLGRDPGSMLKIACEYLSQQPRDWEMFDLRWLDAADLEQQTTLTALHKAGMAARPGVWQQTAIVDILGDWEGYLRDRSPKMRSDLRRRLRKIPAEGSLRFVRYRPEASEEEPDWALLDDAVGVATQSWQNRSTTGTTLCHPVVYPFIRETHAQAAKLGMLDLCLLYQDDQPAAFCYNYHDTRGNLFGLRRGNTPAARDAGLGTTLMALMLRDSFERGDKSLDLGLGTMEDKRRWMTSHRPIGRCTHYPAGNARVQLLRLKHWWQSSTIPPLATP